MLRLAQSGDDAACEALIRDNSALVWSIVRRYAGHGVDMEDLFQLGSMGLLKAIQGFDCDYGTRFSTYAVPKISGEIRRFLRDDGSVKVSRSIKALAIRVNAAREQLTMKTGQEPTISELSDLLEVSPEEIAACEHALMPTDSLQRELGNDGVKLEHMLGDDGIEDKILESVTLQEAMQRLGEKERRIILLRYFRSQTQQQCARQLGISQVQVSRLERKAIEQMRAIMTTDH